MAISLGQTQGVGGATSFSPKEFVAKAVRGAKFIAGKAVEFGGRASANLRAACAKIARQRPNGRSDGATPAMSRGKTFTAAERQTLTDAALNSAFYRSLAGSRSTTVNETTFKSIAEAVMTTPATVEAMKKHGVTLDEAVAISMYSSNAYMEVNGELRSGSPSPEMQGLLDAFSSGLGRLPPFTGNKVNAPGGPRYECYRGASLPESVGNTYQRGATVADTGITSSSFDPSQKFNKNETNFDMVMHLKPGSSGKDISAFSDKPTECEVAFPPGVQFTVVSRDVKDVEAYPYPPDATSHPKLDNYKTKMWTCAVVMAEV